MTDSPSVLLQRAAEHLEALESRAIIGPWDTCGPNVTGGGDEQWDVATASTSTTALWIATMSPAVAAPLAAMLRWDAKRLSWAARCEDVDKSYRGFELARQILGLPSKDEESP